jgi:hypothetical protein
MSAPLRELERIHRRYGPGRAEPKAALLDQLASRRLPTARAVRRFHEVLCFLRAYPDSADLLARVEQLLASFARRPDLRRHATALQDSGIAGTPTYYSFFHPTAQWLAQRWPKQLTVSWPDLERADRLADILHLLALYAETPGLDEAPLSLREWVRRMKGADETDATFLLCRMAALRADVWVRESVFEDLGIMFKLSAGLDTPSRTHAHLPRGRNHHVSDPLSAGRPDLDRVLRQRPPGVTSVPPAAARRMIDLAREAMVSRGRDLDAFAYASPEDVRVVNAGDGLEFVVLGMVPERRLLLESVYGYLTLRNGVPTGYGVVSGLFQSAEVAYNVFDPFRGVEAAHVYGQVLAAFRHLLGCRAFAIYPYQLGGEGNTDGLHSGAWWFYQKLGFRPRAPEAVTLMEKELAMMRRRPAHRSSLATLRRLAAHNLYHHIGRPREDVMGVLPFANVGLAVTDLLARRFGSDREAGERILEREVARILGQGSRRGWTAGERLWSSRWASVVAILPGVVDWPLADRKALGAVIRAKGGRRESDFVRAFDGHRRLRRAIWALATTVR